MARYLSPEWFEEVARLAPAGSGGPALLTLEQVVTGGPDGDVRYQVVLDASGARIARTGGERGADVTFTSDWATASAIASGRLSVQAALGAGRVRVGGDLSALAAHQERLAGADPVPPAVRGATSWAHT